jgi:hypothetical protein
LIQAIPIRKALQRQAAQLALSSVAAGLLHFYSFPSERITLTTAYCAVRSATRPLCDAGDMATSKESSLPLNRSAKPLDSGSELQPLAGVGEGGESINPMGLSDEPEHGEELSRNLRSVPSPGVPISGTEYERLKERAKSVRQAPANHGQEDPSAKP